MTALRVDIDDLTTALSDHDFVWMLDTETGQVLMEEWIEDRGMWEDVGLRPPEGEDEDEWEPLEGDRFIRIEPVESREGFRWMEDFADQQEERVRERLLDALDRPRPFRRFRDALEEHPRVEEAWDRYEEDKLREAARRWVRYARPGLEIELVEAPPPAT